MRKSKNNIKHFDSVAFEVDSTLVTIEGLDFLANSKMIEGDIKRITSKAMSGNLSMIKSMVEKMKAIAPSYVDLKKMGHEYLKNITPGVKKTITLLKSKGINVWIVTGNFQPAVGMLAKYLGINKSNVITNDIFLDKNGNYLGFDTNNPLSNNGGKAIIVKKLKTKMKRVVFVGDGSTDLDTKEVVDLFIGFGGVVNRPAIEKQSEVYIKKNNMEAIIPYIV
ncbi:MAG: HAD-IB family phosphatase [Patescibacteria group bacterium]